jgi:CBS domain-containing protein
MTSTKFVPVKDVMSLEPVTIDGMATVAEALSLMKARNTSSVIVPRRDPRDEYGLILVSDIAREIIGRNRSLERTNAYEVMTKPAPSVDADMDIKYAIRFMSAQGFTHCVVLHGRELAGVVTLREMALRYIALHEA